MDGAITIDLPDEETRRTVFSIDDVLFREDMAEKEQQCLGVVTGFPPSDRWVRVRTMDGRYRIWRCDRCVAISDPVLATECRNDIKNGVLAEKK